jgi:hypothetical protein
MLFANDCGAFIFAHFVMQQPQPQMMVRCVLFCAMRSAANSTPFDRPAWHRASVPA